MRQRLGQYFLHDTGAVAEAISAIGAEIKNVIEIGPGNGALTKPLCESLFKNGGRLIAIEKDPALAEKARDWDLENLEVVEGDALEVLPGLSAELGGQKYSLIGNIPYYLTGFLLRIISELEHKPEQTIFMIQKEVAERIVVKPPEMNRLAASIQFWAEPKIIRNVSKRSFSPSPKVDSAIILLTTTQNPLKTAPEKYYSALRALFAQPRKTVLNNLAAEFKESRKTATEKALAALTRAGVSPDSRPQNLSIKDIEGIADAAF